MKEPFIKQIDHFPTAIQYHTTILQAHVWDLLQHLWPSFLSFYEHLESVATYTVH